MREAFAMSGSSRKRIISELIGTFIVQFLGSFIIINMDDVTLAGSNWSDHHGQQGLTFGALGYGVLLSVMVYSSAGGNGSGGKLNPAISTALFVTKRLNVRDFALELLAQFSGCIFGSILFRLCMPEAYFSSLELKDSSLGIDMVIESWGSMLHCFLCQLLGSFFFVMVFFAGTVDKHNGIHNRLLFPLMIGIAATVQILASGNATVNAAQAVGTALVLYDITGLWLYVGSSFVGGMCGAVFYSRVFLGEPYASILIPGTVFEGFRQDRKEYQSNIFRVYLVVERIEARPAEREHQFHFFGRSFYPDIQNSFATLEGNVTQDGQSLTYREIGGPFPDSEMVGFMPDAGHVAGVQIHSSGLPLANMCFSMMPLRDTKIFLSRHLNEASNLQETELSDIAEETALDAKKIDYVSQTTRDDYSKV